MNDSERLAILLVDLRRAMDSQLQAEAFNRAQGNDAYADQCHAVAGVFEQLLFDDAERHLNQVEGK